MPLTEAHEARTLRDLTPLQWKTGLAAWLGWLFDGLDGYLYILVAAPFVAELIHASGRTDPRIGQYSSYIQAAFLIGWAVGGAVFGRLGDRLGRSRTIRLTILTYAIFTGLAAAAQTWQQLMVLRFLAALGIGGEWAAGSALIAETWPRSWRPWVSACLQSAYQIGSLLGAVAFFFLTDRPRYLFLVGVLPALVVFWMRRAVPEPEAWDRARTQARGHPAGVADLFRGTMRRTTVLLLLLCSLGLTIIWGLLFWAPQQMRNLPDIASWSVVQKGQYISRANALALLAAIGGNFCAAWLARRLGYRGAMVALYLAGLVSMVGGYGVAHDHRTQVTWFCASVCFAGAVFGLFPLYIPPLFPTLLRTTGAGFCYNIGRVIAAVGTVFFGLLSPVGDYRVSLFWVGMLQVPAMGIALLLPEPSNTPEC